jgi:hypothetical protein
MSGSRASGASSKCCYTGDSRGLGLGSLEHVGRLVVDAVEEAVEESGAVVLVAVEGVVSLASQDRDELGSGVEESASFADGLEVAVERGGPRAVSVAEKSSVVGGKASHVGALDRGRRGSLVR